MKWIIRVVLVVIVASVGIQFIPIKRNVSEVVPSTDFIVSYNPPEEVSDVLKTSCYNCHSNNTDYTWYSHIQPVGLYLQKHINKGKEDLNFSNFETYSARRQKSKLTSMINQIKEDKMPLPAYTMIHRDA
jgi:hypothetical protein